MALRFIRFVAAGGAAVAAAALFTTSDRSRPAPSLRAFRIDAGGLALRAVRSGRGHHVLFLHGYGESLVAWRGVFDAVARHADAIAVDLPGFGLSAKPPSGYATDSLATVVLRTLDALGITDVVVVGHSLGGAVAVAAADAAQGNEFAALLGTGENLDAGRQAGQDDGCPHQRGPEGTPQLQGALAAPQPGEVSAQAGGRV